MKNNGYVWLENCTMTFYSITILCYIANKVYKIIRQCDNLNLVNRLWKITKDNNSKNYDDPYKINTSSNSDII